jgi:hypothetical protein
LRITLGTGHHPGRLEFGPPLGQGGKRDSLLPTNAPAKPLNSGMINTVHVSPAIHRRKI